MVNALAPARSIAAAVVLIAAAVVGTISAAPVAAQMKQDAGSAMELTTDTPAYCVYLWDRVSNLVRLAATPVPHDITDLATEGQRMCATGQTRPGVMRLRHALMIMEQRNAAAVR